MTPAKGGTPPFNTPPPPATRLWGEARAKTATFLRRNAGLETESLRMMLSVLRRVPVPVVGVNDAF